MQTPNYNGVARQYPQRSKLSLPPDSKGRHRRWHRGTDGAQYVVVRVPWDHPLVNSNGWVAEGRVAAFEAGLDLYPGDRVFYKNGDRTDCSLSNLVVCRPGDPWPLPTKVYLCQCGCGRRAKRRLGYHEDACWKISDEFAKMTHLSRQRQLQLRWRSQGRCTQCGRKPLVSRNHCKRCQAKVRDRSRSRYHNPTTRKRILAQSAAWKAENAERFKVYQRLKYLHGNKRDWPESALKSYEMIVAAL